MDNEFVYWIAIAHLPRWTQERINTLVIDIINNKQMSLQDFFELDNNLIASTFGCTEKELVDINNVRETLPNLSFQVEQLKNKGIKIINSKLYPKNYEGEFKS